MVSQKAPLLGIGRRCELQEWLGCRHIHSYLEHFSLAPRTLTFFCLSDGYTTPPSYSLGSVRGKSPPAFAQPTTCFVNCAEVCFVCSVSVPCAHRTIRRSDIAVGCHYCRMGNRFFDYICQSSSTVPAAITTDDTL